MVKKLPFKTKTYLKTWTNTTRMYERLYIIENFFLAVFYKLTTIIYIFNASIKLFFFNKHRGKKHHDFDLISSARCDEIWFVFPPCKITTTAMIVVSLNNFNLVLTRYKYKKYTWPHSAVYKTLDEVTVCLPMKAPTPLSDETYNFCSKCPFLF